MIDKVSVLLSAYNAEKYIDEAICSILNQSHKNLELLIMDDGSFDGTLSKINSYSDKRVKVVSRKNKGLTKSLNELIGLASGDYICRHDADDVSDLYRLEKQLAHIKSVGADVVFTQSFDGEASIPKKYMVGKCITLKNLAYGNVLTHGSMLCKVNVLKENTYDSKWRVGQDYELWLRLLKLGYKLDVLFEPLYMLRKHGDSISANNSEQQELLAKKAVELHLGSNFRYVSMRDNKTLRFVKRTFKYVEKLM